MEAEEDTDGKGIDRRFPFLDVAFHAMVGDEDDAGHPPLGIGVPSAEQPGM